MRLILVRHGEALAAVNQRVAGTKGCQGLSPLGVVQAEALAIRLQRTGELGDVAALYASTLPRAIETAAALSPVLGAPVVQDADLCEMDPGEGDGLGWDEFDRRYGPIDSDADPWKPLSPGGESWAAFGVRVGTTMHRLTRAHPNDTVVAVCHGGVIAQTAAHGLGLPTQVPSNQRLGLVPNCSMTEWLVTGDPPRWSLVRYSDAAHLL